MNKGTKDQVLEQPAASSGSKRTEPEYSFKALLAAAPLDGIDLDRAAEKDRAITFDQPQRLPG